MITYAQANFFVKDTICSEEPFSPLNTSTGKPSTWFWHFCSGNLNYSPEGENLGNVSSLNNGPAFIAIATDSGKYYAFITNHVTRSITRYKYGNSLLNTPIADDLGNFGGIIPQHVEGIQVKKNQDGNWYGFISGGQDPNSKLIRLDFGKSLQSSPSVHDFGNIGLLDYPIDLNIIFDNNTWTGFTVNYQSNTITRFDFGSSLANTPKATNMGSFGNSLNHPCGLSTIYTSFWSIFITNIDNKSITRLDFKDALNQLPVVTTFPTAPELDSPFDITFLKDCGQIFGFVVNRLKNDVVRMDFPNGILTTPKYTSLGNIGGLSHPHGITEMYRLDNEIFALVANVDNHTISRLYYTTCTEPSILTSTLEHPEQRFYRNPGRYNILLIEDDGLSTESSYCKDIVVVPKPKVSLPNDTIICRESTLTLHGITSEQNYLWSDSSTINSLSVNIHDSIYWLQVKNYFGCKEKDTIKITRYPVNFSWGNDTTFTLGESIDLDAGAGMQEYRWSTGESTSKITVIKPGTYSVFVIDTHTCKMGDTISIALTIDVPNFFTPNNDNINDRWAPRLFFHYPEAIIQICDRFGKTVASYHGSDPGWDGTYNGLPVAPDTYWYIIDLKNGIKPFTGQVSIKR